MYGCRIVHDFGFDFPETYGSWHRTLTFRHARQSFLPFCKVKSICFLPNQGRRYTLDIQKCLVTGVSRHYRLIIEDIATFYWREYDRTILYDFNENAGPEQLNYWIVRVAIPLFLKMVDNYVILHAACFEINGQADLLLAPSGGGKSHWIAEMESDRVFSLGDDVAALRKEGEEYSVYPSYPYIRLDRKTESLGRPMHYFQPSPLPLGRLFLLHRHQEKRRANVRKIIGIEKYRVMESARDFKLPLIDSTSAQSWLDFINTISLYKLSLPSGSGGVRKAYRAIIELSNGRIEDME